jgi:proton-translocating NAD(P)+ transhydrogenase subunit beta
MLINLSYIVSAVLFIFGLRMLSSPKRARAGNLLSGLGMLIAIVVTLFDKGIISYQWIITGLAVGTVIGFFSARVVAMTAMPEMVALFNGFGGIASLLVGWAVYQLTPNQPVVQIITILLSVFIGGITFTGSMAAFGKLREIISGRALVFRGQRVVNGLILAGIVVASILFALDPPASYVPFLVVVALSFVFGVMFVIPIGGADMPVVISMLNSLSGLAACAAGFVINNNILIVAGALVGASGVILTNVMCKAMNRSLPNVLFSGFGSVAQSSQSVQQGEAKPINSADAFLILEAAQSVVIVPGYGLAVAQAQHSVKELADLLEKNGTDVRFAIHPVAGRMPGHMNVLLAEANVPYEQLVEMDSINPGMSAVDVAVVIGANDVVNPAAREDVGSPIYGMPVINVDEAKTVFVLKRSMATGFAGIQNPLFFKENTRMLFGDAKSSVQQLISEFKDLQN